MCLRDEPGATPLHATLCEQSCKNQNIMRSSHNLPQLDAIDRNILAELQNDGKLSNVELALRVHLSPSACLRRVKQLEEEGVIAQYVALLNPKAVGQHGTSFTIINLETMSNALLGAFEQAVRDEPQILDCYYVAGSNDYLIRFSYRDAEDLERFHTEVLMRLPGVERSNSMLVLRTVKKTTALPL
jgi:Lrp/AsnC family leucine-responsive transcriptional regulator